MLLSEALTPYQVSLEASGFGDKCLVTVTDSVGVVVLERAVNQAQLRDKRSLTDIVDGLHRDLRVAEGRLQPCFIAALRNAAPRDALFAIGRGALTPA